MALHSLDRIRTELQGRQAVRAPGLRRSCCWLLRRPLAGGRLPPRPRPVGGLPLRLPAPGPPSLQLLAPPCRQRPSRPLLLSCGSFFSSNLRRCRPRVRYSFLILTAPSTAVSGVALGTNEDFGRVLLSRVFGDAADVAVRLEWESASRSRMRSRCSEASSTRRPIDLRRPSLK